MTLSSPKPSPNSSYANLRPSDAYGAISSPSAPDAIAVEIDRLERLKDALMIALEQAPDGAIPTALIDLAATYTSALRLQLSLKGQTAIPNPNTRTRAPYTTNKPR